MLVGVAVPALALVSAAALARNRYRPAAVAGVLGLLCEGTAVAALCFAGGHAHAVWLSALATQLLAGWSCPRRHVLKLVRHCFFPLLLLHSAH